MSTQRFWPGVASFEIQSQPSRLVDKQKAEIDRLTANLEYMSYALTVAQNVCTCAQNYRDILIDENNENTSLAAGVLLDNALAIYANVQLVLRQ